MDDIARHISISKKTLYLYFSNKKEVVMAFMLANLEQNKELLTRISIESEDAIHEIIHLMKHFGEMFSRINPTVFYDLQKYFPECWKIFNDFKMHEMTEMIEDNLKKGIDQGVYRSNLNLKIIAKIRVEQIDTILDPTVFPPEKFNMTEVHLAVLELFLRGITSEKGNELIKKYQNVN